MRNETKRNETGAYCSLRNETKRNQIWHEAEEIRLRHEIIDLEEGVHCVTEYRNSVNFVVKGGSYRCRCRQSQSTAGICCHILVVAATIGNFSEFFNRTTKRKVRQTT